jgi:hypothetical protein
MNIIFLNNFDLEIFYIYRLYPIMKINAGIIFYRKSLTGDLEFLLQERYDRKKKHLWLEDLGGKSEPNDNSIYEVAAREAAEESNGVLYGCDSDNITDRINKSKELILEMIKYKSLAIYIRKIRYIIFLVEMNNNNTYDFGDREYHSKFVIQRTINWISKKNLMKKSIKDMHPRIRQFYRLLLK